MNGTFDYRLAARRKDIEGKRLEKVILKAGKLSENLKLPDLPIPARVPDLLPPSRGGGEKPR